MSQSVWKLLDIEIVIVPREQLKIAIKQRNSVFPIGRGGAAEGIHIFLLDTVMFGRKRFDLHVDLQLPRELLRTNYRDSK